MAKEPKIELIKDGKTYFIRKGILKENCVCDNLSIKDLSTLKEKIVKVVKK